SSGWRGTALVLAAVSVAAAPGAYLATRGGSVPPGGSARLRPAVLRDPGVRLAILGYVGHAWELYVARGWTASFLAALLVARGRGEVEGSAEAGETAALLMGMGAAGVALGGWLSDRLGRGRAALAIVVPCGAISLIFGW